MPKFHFELEALLDMRRASERDKQLVVARLERERLDAESRLAACQSELVSHKSDLRTVLAAPTAVDLRSVRLQANASLHAQARAQRLAITLAGLYKRLDGARAELRAATTRRRAVETLKERRRLEWLAAQKKREADELDDLSTARAARADLTDAFSLRSPAPEAGD